MKSKASNLATVLRALKDLELSRLSGAARKMAVIADQIGALKEKKISLQKNAETATEALQLQLLGVEGKWERWQNAKIREHYLTLAKLAAEFEEQKTQTKLALGRDAAFQGLIARERTTQSRS